jgi:hypothetical protein
MNALLQSLGLRAHRQRAATIRNRSQRDAKAFGEPFPKPFAEGFPKPFPKGIDTVPAGVVKTTTPVVKMTTPHRGTGVVQILYTLYRSCTSGDSGVAESATPVAERATPGVTETVTPSKPLRRPFIAVHGDAAVTLGDAQVTHGDVTRDACNAPVTLTALHPIDNGGALIRSTASLHQASPRRVDVYPRSNPQREF